MKKILKSGIFWFIIILLLFFYINYRGVFSGAFKGPEKPAFDQFITLVKKGQVDKVEIKAKDSEIQGTYKNGKQFEVAYPPDYKISDLLVANKISITVNPQKDNIYLVLLIQFAPFLLILFLFFLMLQQMQGAGNKVMSFGKSRAKPATKEQSKVTFKDVAGLDEAIEELLEIKEFLSSPQKFRALNAKIPRGVLLYGPPGSGKTLLAKAVSGEAGVPFYNISGSDFVEMFVGVGASRVRDLFDKAKANSPCIVFIDEIDAVGRHRGAGLGGGHDEREQTLNQLLVEMDGFETSDNVIVMAATNRPDILDPALLRPGRFDRQVVADRPDLEGRKGIIKVHIRGKPMADDVDIDVLARSTPGFTGADIANMVNEGALLSARKGKKEIGMEEVEAAIERVIAGPERKSRIISDKEKAITAFHEAGHALVSHSLPFTNPVHKISIIPRGLSLGYTIMLPTEDKYLAAKSELLNELAGLLGGRASEELIFKDVTTGGQNDLERATKLARKMICEYGMSEKIGPLAFGHKQDQVFLGRDFATTPDYSDKIAFEIDKEVKRLIEEAHEKAKKILTKERSKLEKIAKKLIEVETLEREELERLLGKAPQVEEAPAEKEAKELTPEAKKTKRIPKTITPPIIKKPETQEA